MYKVSIPVKLTEALQKEEVLLAMQRAGAKRVFLATGTVSLDSKKRSKMLKLLREYIPFFQSHGMEVGVWFWSFIYSGIKAEELDDYLMCNTFREKRIIEEDLDGGGNEYTGICCPASEKFATAIEEVFREVAATEPDIIMLDDDYRFGFHDLDMGCFCDAHMRLYEKKLGRKVTREELVEGVYAPKPNTIRRLVWEVLGESLVSFAEKVREAVDSVNPNIRVALCSVMSLWDTDGTDSIRIAKILAGNTKPLLRLIGAPYWAQYRTWGNRLQHTIEVERMQAAWCEGEELEVMTEGDVFPRPRYQVPANFLEGFDMACRAAGVGDGILKYMLDYTASVGYEEGYLRRHVKNADIYSAVERLFSGKRSVGVRIYEARNKFCDTDIWGVDNRKEYVKDQFFSVAARVLADNTVPAAYEGNDGVGIAFGENARYLTEDAFKNGLILDIRAARILMEQGIDVGIEEIGERFDVGQLWYPEGERVDSGYSGKMAYRLSLKEGAEIVTYSIRGEERYPDVFHFQNGEDQRFLVYAFDEATVSDSRYRSYCMQRQLYASIEWLAGKALPAKCAGNPDLYIICKESEKSMAIGLWNFFADDVEEPVVVLGQTYEGAEFVNCTGTLSGSSLKISTIQPYGFAFVNVWK